MTPPVDDERATALPPPLTPLLVVTDRALAARTGRTLADAVDAALDGGPASVLLREKDLGEADRLAIGRQVAAAVGRHGAPLLVAGDHLLAVQLGAVGVHLAAGQPSPDVPPGMLVGRSCHAVHEVVACAASLSYATLSPVLPSLSKPGHGADEPIDADEVGQAAAVGVPVYALGGIVPGAARRWVDLGASGVAVCGAVMAAAEPWRVVADLLAELATPDPAR